VLVSGELPAGSVFAGLMVEALVASGGMGSVYRASDPTLHRAVALKVIAPALADDARFRERFLREARLAASLEHPAIVPVYAAGDSDGRLYLAMRFMGGGSVADLLDRSGSLNLSDTVRLLDGVAHALDAAHRAGLVHRDVKPGNILLQGDRGYVADFGLAVTEELDDVRSSAAGLALSGTTAYLAPELIEGDHATGASDQYALACLAFECLTGRLPFAAGNELAVVYAHLQQPPPSAVALRPELPSTVDAVLARALAKQPRDRFGSCGDFIEALRSTRSVAGESPPAAPDHVHRRRGRLIGVVAAAGVAAAVAATVLMYGGGAARPLAGDGIAVLDGAGGHQALTIGVGRDPLAIVSDGQRNVWVVNADDRTISRLDTRPRSTVGPPFALEDATPSGLAYGEGALWVSTGSAADAIDFGTITSAVVRVDPVTDQPGNPIKLKPSTAAVGFHHSGSQIAAGGGSVWVIDAASEVERIDPATDQPQVIPDDGYAASAIAFGDGAVWVLGEQVSTAGSPKGPFVWRIDPRTHAPSDRIEMQVSGASELTVGAGSVWVASPWDGRVVRIQPGAQVRTQTIDAPGATAVRYDDAGRAVWVADPIDRALRRIDIASNKIGSAVELSGAPQAMAVAGGSVFASVINTGVGSAVQRQAGGDDVRHEGCQGVWSDPRRQPDLLIVGDFPFYHMASRVDSQAVLAVLREHGFRAGRHTIGYQPCNDWNDTDPAGNCADFAGAYARAARVVAVITGYASVCAQPQLPRLLDARPGPIAAIGTENTLDALTDGTYPNYVRLLARDTDQVAAGIHVFAGRQATRVFLLYQQVSSPYFAELATLFDSVSADRVTIVGAVDYSQDGVDLQQLAQRVRRSGANGVYLIGVPDPNTGTLLKALRAATSDLTIVAPDSFNPVADAVSVAGDAARGIYLTSANPPNDLLPATGRQWLHRFAATQLGAQVPTSSSLAAAATQVLLDAIARSDGTRASVVSSLRATNLPDSVIGPIRFTAHGDIGSCAVSVYQIVGGTFSVPDIQSDLQGAKLVQQASCPPAGR
jgi:ABC-type branched-subunit amino acid transport system substrate-binding protein